MIALAFGGNQLRLSGFQFCNLFPKYRSTALTLITGSYAASAGLFMTFQYCAKYKYFSSSSFCSEAKSNQDWRRDGLPVVHSLLSLSSFTHSLWVVLIMSAIIYFNTSFNSWISKISQSNEEDSNMEDEIHAKLKSPILVLDNSFCCDITASNLFII
ncbi:hypothetical protein Avbf_15729 [Armadillidium vulgare]|nr:hypothetical protein Avbf_15729 [Armadillidium vulgare]